MRIREGHFTAIGVKVYAPASEIINDVIFLDCSVQYVVSGRVEELIYNNRRFNRGQKCAIYWEVPGFTTTVTEDTFKKLRSFIISAEDVLLTRKLRKTLTALYEKKHTLLRRNSLFFIYCRMGDVDNVTRLLDDGEDVNKRNLQPVLYIVFYYSDVHCDF